jgi:hypothetical protein
MRSDAPLVGYATGRRLTIFLIFSIAINRIRLDFDAFVAAFHIVSDARSTSVQR